MKKTKIKFTLYTLTAFFCIALLFPFSANAQRRDQLSEMESELVREAQEIDRRMEIFVKAVDRRFLVINNDTSQSKKVEKDSEKWGELPKGTRAQLLLDIEKILEEAISKIDDVAAHDAKSALLPKAVHILADSSKRFLPQLKSQLDKTNTEIEKGAILGAIDSCNQVIEASAKVPKEVKKAKVNRQK
ncbi:MAG: hypothetical protein M3388_04830 [Acidobacteriota bacterium]|nr:hypothetical protein [Acidobacteriota bacterium]